MKLTDQLQVMLDLAKRLEADTSAFAISIDSGYGVVRLTFSPTLVNNMPARAIVFELTEKQ